jgi:hypothetical protein
MTDQWKLEGQYMEACTCEVACPCIMLNDPTEGTCTAVVAWHIEEGGFNGTALGDLNVVVALHTPGNMADGDWEAALYLDDRATAEQQAALGTIFGGEAGGHPAHLAELISDVRGVETVPLTFETDGQSGRIRIGEVGEIGCADAEPVEGQNGAAPTVKDHPLAVAPGYPAVVAKTSRAHFEAHGISFDVSDRNALLSPFSYAGP